MKTLSFGYINRCVDPIQAVRCGVLAEKHGFDAFWVTDHFVDVWPDGDRLEPWSVLSGVAVGTKRIRLGSGVTDTQRSHPARTAQAAACLDVLSRGRAILGIGAGEAMNVVPYGLPWEKSLERVRRLSEAISVIRALWASSRENRSSFEGEFYRLEQAFLGQSPQQKPFLPIYVGAFASSRALEVVGRFGDGWYPWLNTADTYRRRWSVVKEAARLAGRSERSIDAVAQVLVAFPQNPKQKAEALKRAKATLIVEKTILGDLGQTLEVDQYQNLVHLLEEDVSEIMEAVEEVPDETVHRTMAIGGIGEVIEKIDDLEKAGARSFAVFDLLGSRNVNRTMKIFRRIIRHYN